MSNSVPKRSALKDGSEMSKYLGKKALISGRSSPSGRSTYRRKSSLGMATENSPSSQASMSTRSVSCMSSQPTASSIPQSSSETGRVSSDCCACTLSVPRDCWYSRYGRSTSGSMSSMSSAGPCKVNDPTSSMGTVMAMPGD